MTLDSMMFRFVQIGVILLLACSAGCRRGRALGPPKAVPVSTAGMELKLMSFNIRYENPGDPGFFLEIV